MPQMSPMYWTIIIIILITFLSLINSNMPKPNNSINLKKKMNHKTKIMKW